MVDPISYLKRTMWAGSGRRAKSMPLPSTLSACHREIVQLRIANIQLLQYVERLRQGAEDQVKLARMVQGMFPMPDLPRPLGMAREPAPPADHHGVTKQ